MTIWILALVLLASLAGLGYRQGAIRVAFSLVGIIAGARLSGSLAKFVLPAFMAAGLKHPLWLWCLPPLTAFVLVLCAFKIIGLLVHHQVHGYYKHKAGELRFALWQRLNARLGLCLGPVNGTAYLALISVGLYALGYWTVELVTPDGTPPAIRMLNRLAWDTQATGLSRVAKALDPLPDTYYDAADVAGLIFQSPLCEARLARYPGLLSLGELPEFQDLAQDTSFMEMRLKGASVKEVVDHPRIQAILKRPDLLQQIWGTLVPDLTDLRAFLETGRAGKYDSERILGHWLFDVNGTLGAYRQAKPNVISAEMQRMKALFAGAYTRMELVVAPDHQLFLKNVPLFKTKPGAAPAVEMQKLQGQWQSAENGYEFSFSNGAGRNARFEGTRLFVAGEGLTLVFAKED